MQHRKAFVPSLNLSLAGNPFHTLSLCAIFIGAIESIKSITTSSKVKPALSALHSTLIRSADWIPFRSLLNSTILSSHVPGGLDGKTRNV